MLKLIDGSGLGRKIRKSLGSKRKELSEESIAEIVRLFGCFEAAEVATMFDAVGREIGRVTVHEGARVLAPAGGKIKLAPRSRILPNTAFGYRTITVERPIKDKQGGPLLSERGKNKGRPQPDAYLRDTENVPLSEDVQAYLRARSAPPCAGRLDRRRQN